MNEMEKYTAEVIRRASAKKRLRRARLTGVLGASCAALVCAFGLAGMLRPVPSEVAAPTGDLEGAAVLPEGDGIRSEAYVYAEIFVNGEKLLVADTPAEAEAVVEALEEAMNSAEASEHSTGSGHGATDGSVRIVLAAANGRTEEYLLCGSVLYRNNTRESLLLPDEALAKLASRLGIDELLKGE